MLGKRKREKEREKDTEHQQNETFQKACGMLDPRKEERQSRGIGNIRNSRVRARAAVYCDDVGVFGPFSHRRETTRRFTRISFTSRDGCVFTSPRARFCFFFPSISPSIRAPPRRRFFLSAGGNSRDATSRHKRGTPFSAGKGKSRVSCRSSRIVSIIRLGTPAGA